MGVLNSSHYSTLKSMFHLFPFSFVGVLLLKFHVGVQFRIIIMSCLLGGGKGAPLLGCRQADDKSCPWASFVSFSAF